MSGKRDSAVPVSSTSEAQHLLNPPQYPTTTGKSSAGPSRSNGPSPISQLPVPAPFDREIANRDADRRARKRVFFAILWALGLWLFFTGTLSTILSEMVNDGTKHHEHRHGHGGPFFTDCERLGEPAGRLASLVAKVKESGTYQRIVAQSDSSDRQLNNATGLIHVESRYSLPIGALDELFFTASGGYTSGQLVVDGEGYSEEDTVDVQVYGKATEKLLLDESKICKRRSRGEDGSWKSGLELWTPSRRDEHRAKQSLGFTIIITLPRSSTSLRSLSVHAPRFLVDMTPRLRDVTFGTINIHSENAPIYTAELVSTGSISLVTTNALIHSTGLVKADSITLSTTHGPIDGKWLAAKKISTKTLDAGVSGSYSMHDNGLLIVQTTNGKIDIDISLLPSDNVKLESYKVSTKSTNGQIDINFRQQPMGSHLDFDATTTNARAEVKLDPQFQGKFFAETVNGNAKLTGPLTKMNPISGSTERNLAFEPEPRSPFPELHSTVEGTVWWGKKESDIANKGKAIVESSNGAVGIVLK